MATRKPQKARTLRSKIIYTGPVFGIRRDELVEPGGVRTTREMITHSGSVVVLPVAAPLKVTVAKASGSPPPSYPAKRTEWPDETTPLTLQPVSRATSQNRGRSTLLVIGISRAFIWSVSKPKLTQSSTVGFYA